MNQQPAKTRSTFRKLATAVAVMTALGSLGTTALTEGVAHADPPANSVNLSNGVITYTGSPYMDVVHTTLTNGVYTLTHGSRDLTASAPCQRVRFGVVTCPASGVTGLRMDGKDDDDWLHGGPGNDVIIGGPGTDSLWGYDGRDDINGGDGMDDVMGGAGNDTLDGGFSASTTGPSAQLDNGDSIWGGDGIDRVTYLAKPGAVRVTLDEGYGFGGSGGLISVNERDALHEVENVTGSRYNDVIIGDAGTNMLYGTWGNDVIFGGGSADHLFGELGRDSLYGEGGNDTLYQRYATGSDPDVDGKSTCGDRTDMDTVYRDPGDFVGPDCERINPT